MPGLGRVNGAAGRWMPLVVAGLGAAQHYLDVVRLNTIRADLPMLKLLDDTKDLGFVPLPC